MEHITVKMSFRKQYLKVFLLKHFSRDGQTIRFPDKDKLNARLRAYLTVPPENYFPKPSKNEIKIEVPFDSEKDPRIFNHLSERCMNLFEQDIEDVFYAMYFNFSSTIYFEKGRRRNSRNNFLACCGISEEVMSEDSFRKNFHRFLAKKEEKIREIYEGVEIDIVSIWKSTH